MRMKMFYYYELRKELDEISRLEKLVRKSLEDSPEDDGNIRSEMKKGKYPQYYLVTKSDRQKFPYGRYLKKNEINIAKNYIQKEYDEKILAALIARRKVIKRIVMSKDIKTEIESIHSKMSPAKRSLLTPYILSDEEFIEEWNNRVCGNENPYPRSNEFLTEKGEVVRSKSEKMIADKLFFRGIVYKYEAKLQLSKKSVVYPDFTLLNVRTRETFYLEHFGMMDDSDYCKKALEKIELYEENQIYQGEKLFITFESSYKPINMKQIDTIIDRLLL